MNNKDLAYPWIMEKCGSFSGVVKMVIRKYASAYICNGGNPSKYGKPNSIVLTFGRCYKSSKELTAPKAQ